MAGRRAYGSGGGASSNGGEACGVSNLFMLRASSSSPFLGSRSIVSFEDVNNRNNRSNASIIGPLYENREENIIDDELGDYLCHQNPEKKRRLTVEQVQFLEKCFDEENKLGPERKIQLARELGLQPRQVAIWFQNRRARWKTKQLEKDYLALKASYDTLKADYDVLLNEKHKLNTEITVLSDKLMLHNKTEKPQIAAISESEVSKPPAKQEDIVLSSSKIDSTDSESRRYRTGGVHLKTACDSSYIFESDLTREEEEGLRKTIFLQCDDVLPKLDDAGYFSDHRPRPPADGSCGLGFHVEDHAFWSWSY